MESLLRILLKCVGIMLGLVAALWAGVATWGAFSPIVVLHYSKNATSPISVFFNDNDDTRRLSMTPGQTANLRTAMFSEPDMWILLTFPGQSSDHVELATPFSRVEVYIGPAARIERTTVKQEFFARF
jgi:hypothetical protein